MSKSVQIASLAAAGVLLAGCGGGPSGAALAKSPTTAHAASTATSVPAMTQTASATSTPTSSPVAQSIPATCPSFPGFTATADHKPYYLTYEDFGCTYAPAGSETPFSVDYTTQATAGTWANQVLHYENNVATSSGSAPNRVLVSAPAVGPDAEFVKSTDPNDQGRCYLFAPYGNGAVFVSEFNGGPTVDAQCANAAGVYRMLSHPGGPVGD